MARSLPVPKQRIHATTFIGTILDILALVGLVAPALVGSELFVVDGVVEVWIVALGSFRKDDGFCLEQNDFQRTKVLTSINDQTYESYLFINNLIS